MNHFLTAFLAVVLFAASTASAQVTQTQTQTRPQAQGQNQPRPGGDPRESETPLSTVQLAKVKSILAPYKAASLTAEDAKAIKRGLRDAGIPRGRALGEALRAAGFNPDRLNELAPPPPRPSQDGQPSQK